VLGCNVFSVRMVSGYGHTSVLQQEVIRYLAPRSGGTYVDGTLGAGGHSRAILEACAPDGRLIGTDRDPHAITLASERLAEFGDRVKIIHARLSELPQVLSEIGALPVDGILVDLGLSSMQLDDPGRGFSFSRPGPIDMRMDASAEDDTALDLLRVLDKHELTQILRDFGEERFAPRIAAKLGEEARAGRLRTTAELAEAVRSVIPAKAARHQSIHPATRTFQALRIAVNRELAELDAFLDAFPDLLVPGGRMVAISFHSLEDRRVKRRLRDLAWSSSLPPAYAEAAGERVHPICKVLTSRPVVPGDDEIRQNPRARSAKLRACEKVG
jgi:16S rRNA (cytosine1402-N4)-methyltransferase